MGESSTRSDKEKRNNCGEEWERRIDFNKGSHGMEDVHWLWKTQLNN